MHGAGAVGGRSSARGPTHLAGLKKKADAVLAPGPAGRKLLHAEVLRLHVARMHVPIYACWLVSWDAAAASTAGLWQIPCSSSSSSSSLHVCGGRSGPPTRAKSPPQGCWLREAHIDVPPKARQMPLSTALRPVYACKPWQRLLEAACSLWLVVLDCGARLGCFVLAHTGTGTLVVDRGR